MKKGANSIRRKELKKDNVEKFPTYFFEKKNTTGTLFVHACYKVGGNTGLPLVSDAQLLGGTIPRTCPMLISEPDIWEADTRAIHPPWFSKSHLRTGKSSNSKVNRPQPASPSQKYLYPVKVNMCPALKEGLEWYSRIFR